MPKDGERSWKSANRFSRASRRKRLEAVQFYSMQMTADRAMIELREAGIPEPGPQQLLVRMLAAGLNRGELIVGHGLQKAGTAKSIGVEGAGEIAKIGAGVAGREIGQ